jgi:hypothetical protein
MKKLKSLWLLGSMIVTMVGLSIGCANETDRTRSSGKATSEQNAKPPVDPGREGGDGGSDGLGDNGGGEGGELSPRDVTAKTAFTKPVGPKEPASKGIPFRISLSFSNLPKVTTWSLYFHTTKGSAEGGDLITENQPVTQTYYDWDASQVPYGEYFFYVSVKVGDTTGTTTSLGSVDIVDSNVAPTVALTGFFKTGDNVITNVLQSVQYTVAHADNEAMTAKLDYTADAGLTWNVIGEKPLAAGTTGTQYWDWDLATNAVAESARYKLRLTVSDGVFEAEAKTEKYFGVSDLSYTFESAAPTIYGLLATYCGNCHGAGGTNVVQFRSDIYEDAANLVDVYSKRGTLIYKMFDNKISPMPPAAQPQPTPVEKDKIRIWYWQGYAQ